ncbi:MAG: tyrosine-type recombinase/integrase [Anaerolineae bacterium]|nr:tyrosine-type recombinase/integrase [Anaerolineae bacterium]
MNNQLQPLNTRLEIPTEATFDYAKVLMGRASSQHTRRAYTRWVDRFLADGAGLLLTFGKARTQRMHALPLPLLLPIMTAPHLRAWLGHLANEGQGKQALNQARAAIVTLSSLLAEAGLLDDYTSAAMGNVRIPRAEDGQRPGRWLAPEQLKILMISGEAIATTPTQRVRNRVIMGMLCTMALRREELAGARWSDLGTQNGRPVMFVHGKGSKAVYVDIPSNVVQSLQDWSDLFDPALDSALIRRIWKGGRIADSGLTADALWRIVSGAAEHAGLGNVAPHDLRRSIAGALQHTGVSIDVISRLLRHSNVAITERYLSKLPQENEGAVLMADLLGLE